MSKLDKAKERLEILKFWLAIVVGTFLALGVDGAKLQNS